MNLTRYFRFCIFPSYYFNELFPIYPVQYLLSPLSLTPTAGFGVAKLLPFPIPTKFFYTFFTTFFTPEN